MANQNTLTASNIRYLLAIKELDGANGVRCVDIAEALGVSKPSVHNMMDAFSKMGLVTRDAYSAVSLTEAGRETAERYSRCYRQVSRMLDDSFPGITDISQAVCALLTHIPEDSLQ